MARGGPPNGMELRLSSVLRRVFNRAGSHPKGETAAVGNPPESIPLGPGAGSTALFRFKGFTKSRNPCKL